MLLISSSAGDEPWELGKVSNNRSTRQPGIAAPFYPDGSNKAILVCEARELAESSLLVSREFM